MTIALFIAAWLAASLCLSPIIGGVIRAGGAGDLQIDNRHG